MTEKVHTHPQVISKDFREIPSLLEHLSVDVHINKVEYYLTGKQKFVLINTERQTIKVYVGDIVQVDDGNLIICYNGEVSSWRL